MPMFIQNWSKIDKAMGLSVHADNPSALGAGLVVGDLYRTST